MSVCVGETFQDKHESIPYTIDFAPALNSATISTATWTASTDFTIENTSNTDTTASIRISGGHVGTTYKVECTASASDGSRHQGHLLVTVTN